MARDFEYQCEGIYGLTGSGKTTFAMMRAAEMAAEGLRIYTNIEFSIDALRHHMLRRFGHRLCADLPDTDDPFEQDRIIREYRRIPRLHRMFHRIESEDVGDFWRVVPLGPAVVIIDEAHLWFDQRDQLKGEKRQLSKYLSQHRKLRHHVWMISQFPTMLSHSFRKQQHIHWEVRNSRQVAIPLGVMSLRLPFEGFFYSGWYHDEKGSRVASDTILACLPRNRWIWDLFDSRELHAGMGDLVAKE